MVDVYEFGKRSLQDCITKRSLGTRENLPSPFVFSAFFVVNTGRIRG